MSRDEFSARTRQVLASRAGQRCSNPSCRRATCKADPVDESNYIDLGIAAHITAASSGGPRYDPTISSEDRRSTKNGIWLCHRCAKEVDAAVSAYSVEVLKTWKIQAETITARDVAATPDEIASLIAQIERVTGEINSYIAIQAEESHTYLMASKENWDEYTSKMIKQSHDTQLGYDRLFEPIIQEITTRSTNILGPDNEAVSQTKGVATYARTNLLGMRDMVILLEQLRVNLLLR